MKNFKNEVWKGVEDFNVLTIMKQEVWGHDCG